MLSSEVILPPLLHDHALLLYASPVVRSIAQLPACSLQLGASGSGVMRCRNGDPDAPDLDGVDLDPL